MISWSGNQAMPNSAMAGREPESQIASTRHGSTAPTTKETTKNSNRLARPSKVITPIAVRCSLVVQLGTRTRAVARLEPRVGTCREEF